MYKKREQEGYASPCPQHHITHTPQSVNETIGAGNYSWV